MITKIRKIALINPRKNLQDQNPEVYNMFERNKNTLRPWYAPPMSLLIIASHTPMDIKVIIFDEFIEEIDFNEQFDLVGITAMTQQANRAYEIADIYRKRNIPVVMGGIHATVLPEEALQHVNTVFLGESEKLWPQFLKDFEYGAEKKIYSGEGFFDLSESKVPRYELLNYSKFKENNNYFKLLPVQATRGCPHDCSFCVVSKFYGKKIRKKPVKMVIEDIKSMQDLGFDSQILFTDDNLFVDRKYVKELLTALIPLKIKYIAQSDVKLANDPELLKLAYQSGCLMVLIGFESIEANSLNQINSNNWKMKEVQNYQKAILTIQDNGIVVFGAFVIGFKNDNIITFESIKKFALENKIPGQFTLLTPLPGSRVFDELKQEGRLLNNSFWDKCSFFSMTFNHDHITKKEGEDKLIGIYDNIYSAENVMNRSYHMMQIYKKLPHRWS